MHEISKTIGLLAAALLLSHAAYGEEVSKEQIKGLDEQVQEIKSDALSITAELNRLEEKLLYPSNTEVALFVSLAGKGTFRLDALEIRLDGKAVANHLYTFKELEALQEGGVQRIFTGNIRLGEHALEVTLIGKSAGGSALRRTQSFRLSKEVGPRIAEIALTEDAMTLKDW